MFNTATTTSAFTFGPSIGQSAFGQPSLGSNQPLGGQTSLGLNFGGQQQQPPQQQSIQGASGHPLTVTELFNPKIFNDERDQILGKFNRIQAYWGSGKAIYSADGTNIQQVELTPHHVAHRFKGIAYSEYRKDDADDKKIGVLVRFSDESTLKTSIMRYENNMKSILNNLQAKVESTKLLPGKKALLTFSAMDPTTHAQVPSLPVMNHLMSVNIRNQLNQVFENNLIQLVPLSSASKQEVEEYLASPPHGLDPLIWSQAKLENPDPDRFIPVPLIGFQSLNDRFKLQEQEISQQKTRIKMISDAVYLLERSVESSRAKLEECRKRNIPLRGKVLRAMIYQEIMRKRGFPVSPEEDQMRASLEKMRAELTAPTKFRGCLNELMSKVRQTHPQTTPASVPSLSDATLSDLKTHLKQEQQAISHLLSILRDDHQTLSRLSSAMHH